MSLGANIAKRRIDCNLSQKDLAERLGIDVAHVCRIEKDSKAPSVGVLVDIANILDTSTDKLLGREQEGGSM